MFHSLDLPFFFFNDTAPTEIYPLSLHDALPISRGRDIHDLCERRAGHLAPGALGVPPRPAARICLALPHRSEEHTSELQSRLHLVCRLLLEKKKKADWQARPWRVSATTSVTAKT